MHETDLLTRTLARARSTWLAGDRTGWARRVTSGMELEAERRRYTRPISRRGARSSYPASDRLAQRFIS
jgi:hypothetical protein